MHHTSSSLWEAAFEEPLYFVYCTKSTQMVLEKVDREGNKTPNPTLKYSPPEFGHAGLNSETILQLERNS